MSGKYLQELGARAHDWPANHPAGWYVLKGLVVPYSEANLALAFKPSMFFHELDRMGRKQRWFKQKKLSGASVFKNHYYRYLKKGLIRIDSGGMPLLTDRGMAELDKYEPAILTKGVVVMVIFDIPEVNRVMRNRLRVVLRNFYFTQVQKSVWQSKYDVAKYVRLEMQQQQLGSMVKIFEAAEITT